MPFEIRVLYSKKIPLGTRKNTKSHDQKICRTKTRRKTVSGSHLSRKDPYISEELTMDREKNGWKCRGSKLSETGGYKMDSSNDRSTSERKVY